MALTDSEIERAKSREKSYSLRDSEERQAMALEVSVRWQRNWARRSFDALFKLNLIVEMFGGQTGLLDFAEASLDPYSRAAA